ncbi:MAG TPA: bifunctional oligoribonuclease/PAP phosphatase NrnA [Spirochaetia bacterium]|nr:bifunctional oligoribonuclease/PAP phosphatase NrnA [Spirochaetia bacterium]
MAIIPGARSTAEIRRFFEQHDRFAVLGHTEPDGDCVASQLVLACWLRRRGKHAVTINAGPFDRPEVSGHRELFEQNTDRFQLSGDGPARDADKQTSSAAAAVILVDCSMPERTGFEPSGLFKLPCLVIDHHAEGERFGDLLFVDSAFPSTTLLILDLMESFGDQPERGEADLLLFGFCTDTGFFRHLDGESSDAFQYVSRLIRYGASPNRIYRLIYAERYLEQFVLLGRLLIRTESYAGGRVLLSWQSLEDRTEGRTAKSMRASDDLYKHLQSVRNNEVVVLIKQENDGECSVSLRSSDRINVGQLARSQGGGGHPRAAGFTCTGSIDAVRERILKLLSRHYEL